MISEETKSINNIQHKEYKWLRKETEKISTCNQDHFMKGEIFLHN